MNREIKFRAWDSNEKFFHTPMTIEQMLEICCLPSDAIGLMAVKFKITRSSLVFQQFSGLLDKNGKEIYESDRVLWKNRRKATVVYYNAGFYLVCDDEPKSYYPLIYTVKVEVIGNIYETPELLSQ